VLAPEPVQAICTGEKLLAPCLDSNPGLSARSLVTVPTASSASSTGSNAVPLGYRGEVEGSTAGGRK
jgi:hypothetical protein